MEVLYTSQVKKKKKKIEGGKGTKITARRKPENIILIKLLPISLLPIELALSDTLQKK